MKIWIYTFCREFNWVLHAMIQHPACGNCWAFSTWRFSSSAHCLSSCEIGLNCPLDHFCISSQRSCLHFTSNLVNSIEAYIALSHWTLLNRQNADTLSSLVEYSWPTPISSEVSPARCAWRDALCTHAQWPSLWTMNIGAAEMLARDGL